jgi:hypothetical protein
MRVEKGGDLLLQEVSLEDAQPFPAKAYAIENK